MLELGTSLLEGAMQPPWHPAEMQLLTVRNSSYLLFLLVVFSRCLFLHVGFFTSTCLLFRISFLSFGSSSLVVRHLLLSAVVIVFSSVVYSYSSTCIQVL
jgi:hypothetical protein